MDINKECQEFFQTKHPGALPESIVERRLRQNSKRRRGRIALLGAAGAATVASFAGGLNGIAEAIDNNPRGTSNPATQLESASSRTETYSEPGTEITCDAGKVVAIEGSHGPLDTLTVDPSTNPGAQALIEFRARGGKYIEP